ncbi:MAG: phenylalanine--tRNA ligase subunit beta [Candidatus Omnitrophica bacterium]|nr:phenylalanine--tRNA ligase subunit beta [Candidatus Omnitrophota bacterium]
MKISLNWLKDFVKLTAPPDQIAERLTMAGLEVKAIDAFGNDQVMEIEITSNRPDWLSHLGVAREISSIENIPLTLPFGRGDGMKIQTGSVPDDFKLTLEEKESCPYYTGILIEGIQPGPTPDFIKDRLQACGMRSVSLIVDITNYVLLETGQPLHAFDSRFLSGKRIVIRRAKQGEAFTPIKGNDLKLTQDDLVIADPEKALALAGVMGGKNSEIHSDTQSVFLESAFFQPRGVRQTSLRHAIKSDSSYRFERRVDPEMVDKARDRALDLICQFAKPRQIGKVLRVGKKPKSFSSVIVLHETDVENQLGTNIPIKKSAAILSRLGLQIKLSGKKIKAVIPSFRPDLTRPVDLIEEIARIYGYDHIPETLPVTQPLFHQSSFESFHALIENSRDFFAGQGFYETVTFSLVKDPGPEMETFGNFPVAIINPMNQELNQMRMTLLHSILGVLQRNIDHQAKSGAFFEIANLYTWNPARLQPQEEKTLGLCIWGDWRPKNWLDTGRGATYYDLKGILQEFFDRKLGPDKIKFNSSPAPFMDQGVCQKILAGANELGFLGAVNSGLLQKLGLEEKVFYAEISLQSIRQELTGSSHFSELPKYPSMERDLSLIVEDKVKSGQVEEAIRILGGSLVIKSELFDIFRGDRIPKGFKNLSYRVTYQSPQVTLRSEEIHELHFKIAAELQEKFKATFQS